MELDYAQKVADILDSERRQLFLALLGEQIALAGRGNYPLASEADDSTRLARFAALTEALQVLTNQLIADASGDNAAGYPADSFAETMRGKAGMYDPDGDAQVRACLFNALKRLERQQPG